VLIDSGIGFRAEGTGAEARRAEEAGFAGVWTAEASHDPMLILTQAALTTDRLELGTGIMVAFGRTPMTMAMTANDIQLLSKGRLLLGLGSQIRPHIEKRYSMPWSHPAARMREFISAMRAIWECWNEGTELDFRGDFYTHSLMTPMFRPEPNPYGAPKVFLAAVGELMTQVAGEVADGLLVHPFTTERYLKEVTVPALDRGLATAGRSRQSMQISYSAMVMTGGTDEEVEASRGRLLAQLAFYASTPAYRPVLDLHGWGELQPELNALSKRGEWSAMAELIPDEMLDAFAVVARPADVASRLRERFGGVVDRISFYSHTSMTQPYWAEVLAGFQQ